MQVKLLSEIELCLANFPTLSIQIEVTEMRPCCYLLKLSSQKCLFKSFSCTIFTVKYTFEKSSSRLLVGISLPMYVYEMLFSLSNTQSCRNFPQEAAWAVPSESHCGEKASCMAEVPGRSELFSP